jgi:hypothetical protein
MSRMGTTIAGFDEEQADLIKQQTRGANTVVALAALQP